VATLACTTTATTSESRGFFKLRLSIGGMYGEIQFLPRYPLVVWFLVTAFDLQIRTRLIHGPGTVAQLGLLAKELNAQRVLLVTDPGIRAAGHAGQGINALKQAGIVTELFDGTGENPTTKHVATGLVVAKEFCPDLIVGFGGGSSMDCAKGINFLLTNGGEIRDYWGIGKARLPLLPMIAVPTTAGTGSEAQSFALISDAQTHVKMACGDKKAAFRVAILDPELTVTQPARVTALTGIDALSHALESYVTRTRHAASMLFAREAFVLIAANLPRVLQSPTDLAARGSMQLGACYAGLAIENSMLGIAHSCANPLTAEFGIVHGQAVAVTLAQVIRFNSAVVESLYQELLRAAAGVPNMPAVSTGANGLAEFVQQCIQQAGLKTRLSELNVPREKLPELATAAAKQWTASYNPRPVTEADLLQIYEAAW
jgi:alcohol dehydrogenase